MKHTNRTTKRAFTLIELLIVIAIIGILFVVLISRVDFATDKAKASGVQTDFRSFQVAFETVSQENAGFASLGWDTGDENGNRKRDSYDEGDTNTNNIMESTETWTGHKVYGEDWTGTYTLVNPDDDTDKSAFKLLEDKVNANLDPKLHITITPEENAGVLTGNAKVTMANGAQDPWKNEYHGVYITNALNDKADRGAFIIYSNGANDQWGSEHDIANGIVSIIVPGNNIRGKDDYSMSVFYTYANGYGENAIITTGFSNNQTFLGKGSSNLDNVGDIVVDNKPQKPDVPDYSDKRPGLYTTGTNFEDLIYTWEELLAMNVVDQWGGAYGSSYANPSSNAINTLKGDLVVAAGTSNNLKSGAYRNCTNLTGIVLPDTITEINYEAFYGCKNLSFVQFPNNLENIYQDAFNWCTALQTVVLPESLQLVSNNAFRYSGIQTLYMPSLTVAGEYAFADCKNLENVYLPDNLTVLSKAMFLNCSALTTIRLPSTLTEIKAVALSGCNLSELYLPPSITTLGDSIISGNANMQTLIYDVKQLTTALTSKSYPLQGSYQKVIIGKHVEIIPAFLFGGYYDHSFKTLEFEEGSICHTIQGSAFAECYDSFEELIIPDSVTTIGGKAFHNIHSLKTLVLGKNIKTIGNNAFASCAHVEELYVYSTHIDSCGDNIFNALGDSVDGGIYVFIAKNVEIIPEKFMYATNDTVNINKIEFEEGSVCKRVEAYGLKSIRTKEIILPDCLEYVGDYGFHGVQLDELILPNSLTYVGSNAFRGGASKITLSESLTYIGDYAFYGLHPDRLIIPDSVVEIGQYAFGSGIKKVVIGRSVQKIGKDAIDIAYRGEIWFVGSTPQAGINSNSFSFSWDSSATCYVLEEYLEEYKTWNNQLNYSFTTLVGVPEIVY